MMVKRDGGVVAIGPQGASDSLSTSFLPCRLTDGKVRRGK